MLIDPHLSAAWRGAFAAPEGCKDFADSITLHRKDNITRWRDKNTPLLCKLAESSPEAH